MSKNVLVLPNNWNQGSYDPPEAPEFPEEEVDGAKVLVCAGYYAPGFYEGTGEALVILEDGRAALFALGHCSCYGPWDSWQDEEFTDYMDLKESMQQNTDYWESIRPIFEHCETHFAKQ